MSASHRILDDVRRAPRAMRFLGASGQLGYGIPTPAFNAGLARQPDLIGGYGLIDIGPTYLARARWPRRPWQRDVTCARCCWARGRRMCRW